MTGEVGAANNTNDGSGFLGFSTQEFNVDGYCNPEFNKDGVATNQRTSAIIKSVQVEWGQAIA